MVRLDPAAGELSFSLQENGEEKLIGTMEGANGVVGEVSWQNGSIQSSGCEHADAKDRVSLSVSEGELQRRWLPHRGTDHFCPLKRC